MFSDVELSRRLERAEAHANAQFVEARARVSPASGAGWTEVAGTYAMYDGPRSPVTQTFGLGLFEEPTGQPARRQVPHSPAERVRIPANSPNSSV